MCYNAIIKKVSKSVDSVLLSDESAKTTETHKFLCLFFLKNLQYAMEVQAHCQALIGDTNRSLLLLYFICYVHNCMRSSVTFCNKNNLLSGFFKIRN